MKIGVALCTYNGERFLQEQLDSILAQTRRPDLLLIQDDGSRDRTLPILHAYASRTPFPVEIVRNSANVGFVRNFEQIILKCKAEIVVLCDQDDYWRHDKLELIEEFFASDEKASVVFSDAEMVDEDRIPLGYGLLEALSVSAMEAAFVRSGNFLPVLLRRNIAAGATIALRALRAQRSLPIPDGAYHDEWIVLLAAVFGELRYIPEPLIQYRQHARNLLGARRPRAAERMRGLLQSRQIENRRRLRVMEGLLERLAVLGAPAISVSDIREKRDHLQVRISLPPQRLLRVHPIMRELSSGRYARYSSGMRTALRDLVSPVL